MSVFFPTLSNSFLRRQVRTQLMQMMASVILICSGNRWIFFDFSSGLDQALGGKPIPSTHERWFMVYNAGKAFEPLSKRTEWNWFCHG